MAQSVIIEDNAAVSSATLVGKDQKLASIFISKSAGPWVAADLVMEIAETADAKDADFLPICKDDAGAPLYLIPMADGKRIALDKTSMALAAVEGYVRFRSKTAGTGAADVVQTGGPLTLTVDIK